MHYRPRIADRELDQLLSSVGAVLIEGPRACGKTMTASRRAATVVRLDVDRGARQAAVAAPELLLQGSSPILIDEWQIEPSLWDHVRRAVDDRSPAKGEFILTGSAVPRDDARRHSGAGRIATLRMWPMSLTESGHSTGEMSLARLLDGNSEAAGDPGLTIRGVVDRIVVGGWPALQADPVDDAARAVRGYLDQISNIDISQVGGSRRDPAKVARVIASLSRLVATEAKLTQIATDVGGAEGPVGRETVAEYLSVLERLLVVENQPAWGPRLRSRAPVRQSPKRHFVDPSLAVAALRAGPERLLANLDWTGQLFESLVVRDLRVYAQPLGGTVSHFRDSKGQKVDAIVQIPDGRWAAFEVKLGAAQVDRAAASLRRFADNVVKDADGRDVTLGVIIPTGFGYRRPDGVHVIPVGALGP